MMLSHLTNVKWRFVQNNLTPSDPRCKELSYVAIFSYLNCDGGKPCQRRRAPRVKCKLGKGVPPAKSVKLLAARRGGRRGFPSHNAFLGGLPPPAAMDSEKRESSLNS
eukprot:6184790-Pleurochrysis_carterae.AAC.2